MYTNDNICAIATGSVTSAIAIIRISGYNLLEAIIPNIKFHKPKNIENIKPRYLYRAIFVENEQIIDDILFAYYKSPNSYTGEEMIEIFCHGSLYIQGKILNILQKAGIRIAQPGEFTLRAYLNNKMDLTQAEAINDIINSRNEIAHQLAIQHIRGGISTEIKNLRNDLLNILTYIELELDFSEEDVEFASQEKIYTILNNIIEKIQKLIKSYNYGNVIKNGVLVSIVGETNVGKSTLMNCLLNEDKSIISSIPGTTRDIIEDSFTYQGITFRFADTAGIRETSNEIEQIGIDRALKKAKQSTIVLLLLNPDDNTNEMINKIKFWKNELNDNNKIYAVINKIDKVNEEIINFKITAISQYTDKTFAISAKYKININLLLDDMVNYIKSMNISGSEYIITNSRQLYALEKALNSAIEAKKALDNNYTHDLLAEELKNVNRSLSEIIGEIPTDEILNEIFSRFCIGK